MAVISVIIPTLNEARYLPRLLADLQRQTQPPDEIIIVDGGSRDGTLESIKKSRSIRVLRTKKGTALQRNTGAAQARGQHLLFVDSDVRLHPTFIAQALAAMQRRQLAIACPRYVPLTRSRRIRLFFRLINHAFWLSQFVRPSGAGTAILVKRSLHEQTGGFPQMILAEDLAYLVSASRLGKFGVVSTPVYFSVRRFDHFGKRHMFGLYFQVGIAHLTNRLETLQSIRYPGGIFSTPKPRRRSRT